MVAYLLCAGFGTRMRPLTDDTPKSLLPIDDRPLLDYLIDDLLGWRALETIHLVVNQRDEPEFRDWKSEWESTIAGNDISLRIHEDGVSSPKNQLGAVGDLHFLLDQTGVPSDGALISGGDSVYRFPLPPLLNAFDGTTNRILALYEPDARRRRHSSTLRLDGSRVTGLVDDPEGAASSRICPSWHLLTPSALKTVAPYLDAGGDPDSLGRFIDALARKEPVDAVRLPERPNLRLHCNTPRDLWRAQIRLENEPQYLLESDAVRQRLRN